MKLHRFFIPNTLQSGQQYTMTEEELLHQLFHVLRLGIGDALILADGVGNDAFCHIETATKHALRVRVESIEQNRRELPRALAVCCSILKKDHFDLVVEKLTELGVTTIIPIIAERTVKFDLRLDRLQTIAKEAAEQSGRAVIPTITQPTPFSHLIKEYSLDQRIFFEPGSPPLSSPFAQRGNEGVRIAIGPEGGWSPAELQMAKESGWTLAGLTPTILRAETAAIAATALVVATRFA